MPQWMAGWIEAHGESARCGWRAVAGGSRAKGAKSMAGMRRRLMILGLLGVASLGISWASAEDLPWPSGMATPQAGSQGIPAQGTVTSTPQGPGLPVLPAPQSPGPGIPSGGRTGVATLRNPFSGEVVEEKRGLVQWLRAAPQSAVPRVGSEDSFGGVQPDAAASRGGRGTRRVPLDGASTDARCRGGLATTPGGLAASSPAGSTAGAEAFESAMGADGARLRRRTGSVEPGLPHARWPGPALLRQNLRFPGVPSPLPPGVPTPGNNPAPWPPDRSRPSCRPSLESRLPTTSTPGPWTACG